MGEIGKMILVRGTEREEANIQEREKRNKKRGERKRG